MTFKTICEKVGHKPTRLFEYGAMRTAVEACTVRTEPCVENTKLSTDNHAQSVFRPRQFRLRLVEANKTELIAVNFWRNKCGIKAEKERWTLASKCTSETRLRLLQWKILHNIYPTSILLNKMGISNSKNSAFGCNQTDYPEHFFFSCKKKKVSLTMEVEAVTHALLWNVSKGDSQLDMPSSSQNRCCFCQKVKNGMGSPVWHVSMFIVHFSKNPVDVLL